VEESSELFPCVLWCGRSSFRFDSGRIPTLVVLWLARAGQGREMTKGKENPAAVAGAQTRATKSNPLLSFHLQSKIGDNLEKLKRNSAINRPVRNGASWGLQLVTIQ